MTKFVIGDSLEAIDPCEVDDGQKTLTVGKNYSVIFARDNYFEIFDDHGETHGFDYNDDPFFKKSVLQAVTRSKDPSDKNFIKFVLSCTNGRLVSASQQGNPTEYSFQRLNNNNAIAFDLLNGGVYDVYKAPQMEIPEITLLKGFKPTN